MNEPIELPTRVVRTLGDPVGWDDPPPRLRSQILATAAVERRRRDHGEPVREPVEPAATPCGPAVRLDKLGALRTPLDGRVVTIRCRTMCRALAVAAAVAASVVGVGIVMRATSSDDHVRLALTASDVASDARGLAELRPLTSGMEVTLRVDRLAPAVDGTYYAAWLRGEGGMVPLGSFHWRAGGSNDEVVLWSAVPLIDFPTMVVTRQHIGESPMPTDDIVLTSAVAVEP